MKRSAAALGEGNCCAAPHHTSGNPAAPCHPSLPPYSYHAYSYHRRAPPATPTPARVLHRRAAGPAVRPLSYGGGGADDAEAEAKADDLSCTAVPMEMEVACPALKRARHNACRAASPAPQECPQRLTQQQHIWRQQCQRHQPAGSGGRSPGRHGVARTGLSETALAAHHKSLAMATRCSALSESLAQQRRADARRLRVRSASSPAGLPAAVALPRRARSTSREMDALDLGGSEAAATAAGGGGPSPRARAPPPPPGFSYGLIGDYLAETLARLRTKLRAGSAAETLVEGFEQLLGVTVTVGVVAAWQQRGLDRLYDESAAAHRLPPWGEDPTGAMAAIGPAAAAAAVQANRTLAAMVRDLALAWTKALRALRIDCCLARVDFGQAVCFLHQLSEQLEALYVVELRPVLVYISNLTSVAT